MILFNAFALYLASAYSATCKFEREAPAASPLIALAQPYQANLSVRTRYLNEIPYLEVTVDRPKRTIILVHGGPDVPTLTDADPFDRYLASTFQARVIKPVYYGSSERSPWATAPRLNLKHGTSKKEAARRVVLAIREAYQGMPQAVREIRGFIENWDAKSTIVIGESHGALVAALSMQVPLHSRLVLVAPMLVTTQASFDAARQGTYQGAKVTGVTLKSDGQDFLKHLFSSAEEVRELENVTGLAYYEPWHKTELSTVLRRVPGKVTVIIGLLDRVGMIKGTEWRRFKELSPKRTHVCLDPKLGHSLPTFSSIAKTCFEDTIFDANVATTALTR